MRLIIKAIRLHRRNSASNRNSSSSNKHNQRRSSRGLRRVTLGKTDERNSRSIYRDSQVSHVLKQREQINLQKLRGFSQPL